MVCDASENLLGKVHSPPLQTLKPTLYRRSAPVISRQTARSAISPWGQNLNRAHPPSFRGQRREASYQPVAAVG